MTGNQFQSVMAALGHTTPESAAAFLGISADRIARIQGDQEFPSLLQYVLAHTNTDEGAIVLHTLWQGYAASSP